MNDTKSVLADKCDVMFGFFHELTSEVFCSTILLLCTLTPTLIMSFDYLRQVVSGKKARYVDRENSVDLDLVYGEQHLEPFVQLANHQSPTESSCLSYLAACNAWLTRTSMGYPATGMAGLYRNRRQDVLKFINSRHGEKWWIWNL